MRPAQALIDAGAFCHNYQVARQYAPNARVMAVIKANGYGHGAVSLARALPEADAFGVACVEEALELRESGIRQPILLLEGFFNPDELVTICRNNLDVVLHCPEQVEQLLAATLPTPLHIWLKLDTGMHRVGLPPDSLISVYDSLKASGKVQSFRLMTHFACADDPERHETVTEQIGCFQRSTENLVGEISLANSAALVACPESHGDWVRAGIMLYGVNPLVEAHPVAQQLRPVMTLRSRLIAVRDVPAGEYVGYGQTWQAQQRARIGTVAMGYGDGYPRHAANGTPVLVNGQRTVIAGRVSMDMLTVNLAAMPNAQVGDEVVLWGAGLPAWEVAQHSGTIAYELLSKVTSRVPKIYR